MMKSIITRTFSISLFIACLFQTAFSQCEDLAENPNDRLTISNPHRENQIEHIGMISSTLNSDASYFDQFQIPEFSNGFARAFWIGGQDPAGNLKLAAKDYVAGEDYVPGPILDINTPLNPEFCEFYGRAWIVTALEILQLQSDFESGNLSIENIAADILEWPGRGNPHIGDFAPQDRLAPFKDLNGDGIYDPLDGDHPIAMEEHVDFLPYAFNFTVYNDLSDHGESSGIPIGIEIQQINYVLNCGSEDPSTHTVYTRAVFVYKGVETLMNTRIALWEDVDLGCYEQDLIGCDTILNANFTYNRNGIDAELCQEVGITPIPDENATIRSTIFLNSDLESFIYNARAGFGNPSNLTTDPDNAPEFYNYMNARWRDGSPLTEGNEGLDPNEQTTMFAFPGLPSDNNGWSMQSVDLPDRDYRAVSTFYSGDLLPGQRLTFDIADYVFYDKVNTGLSAFDFWRGKISEIQESYNNIGTAEQCSNGLVACETDCVRPGDINNDGTVSGLDFIIGGALVAQNLTGPAREIQSNYWFPFSSTDWTGGFDIANAKHGDTNGNGIINAQDLSAVRQNFDLFTEDSDYEVEPLGPLQDLNIHLVYDSAQVDIDYAQVATQFDRWIRLKFTLEYDTPGANVPIHGLSYDVKLDDKINGALIPFLIAGFDASFATLERDPEQDNKILNDDNTFSTCWTQTDGINLESELDISVTLIFILAEDLTTENKDGIENINIEVFNIKGINAAGEFIDIGYVQENLSVFNIPWNGADSTDELDQNKSVFNVFPNPATEEINITFDEPTSGNAQLIGVNGNIYTNSIFHSQKDMILNTSDLPQGMYYFKVLFEDGSFSSQKVIKIR